MSQNNDILTAEEAARQAEELTAEAFEALENGQGTRVAEICADLRVMHYSSCFELEALLALDQGLPARALEVLDEGLGVVPELWPLWQLRGNILSDGGKWDAALESYERALALDGADVNSLRLNRATALWRAQKIEEALGEIARTDGSSEEMSVSLEWRLQAVRLALWSETHRCEEVDARAAQLWDEQEELEIDEDEAPPLSVAFSQLGWALFNCGQIERAREWSGAALEVDRANGQALLLARESTPDLPMGAAMFRVVLRGQTESEDDLVGFVTTLFAIAPDVAVAEQLALEFEAPRWKCDIKVEESERIGSCESQPSCIYEVDGYVLVPLED